MDIISEPSIIQFANPKSDMTEDINTLLSEYKEIYEDHPMTKVLLAGLSKVQSTGRRGGRSGRSYK